MATKSFNARSGISLGTTPFELVDANGAIILPASTTTKSGLNVAPGSAPTAPVNGDLWSTTTGFFGRVNGATVGPFLDSSGTITNATNSVNIGITDDTTTNATMDLLWVTSNSGNLPAKVSSTKLNFNPSTGTLTTTALTTDTLNASAVGATSTLWSNTTTGTIKIGDGITTGSIKIGNTGATAKVIAIGVAAATTTINGTLVLPNVAASGSISFILKTDGSNNVTQATGPEIAGVINNTFITNATNATNATNLNAGGPNTVVYQSSAGVTAYLTNGTTGQIMIATTGSAPSWSATPTITTSLTVPLIQGTSSTGGTVTIRGGTDTTGTVALNAATINSSASTVTFFGTPTTVNAFGAATTVSIGAATGNTTVNNSLVVAGNLTVNGLSSILHDQTVQIEDKTIELGSVNSLVATTGNSSVGSAVVTGITSTNGFYVGQPVVVASGSLTLIAATTITSIDSLTQVTLNHTFGGSGTSTTLSFGITGNSSSGSAVVTGMATVVGIIVGMAVTVQAGALTLAGGTTVLSVDSTTQITLSVTFGGSGTTTTLNFGGATNVTANGGGIILHGTTDKTILWDSTNSNFTSTEHWNLATAKIYKINNITAISQTTVNVGLVGTGNGSLTLNGTTSGTITITPANNAAGTWTLGLPANIGTANQLVYTDGTNKWLYSTATFPTGAIAAGTVLVSATVNTVTATTSPTLGGVGLGTGAVNLSGNTSGTITLTTSAAAGTWTLTLPNSAGSGSATDGQFVASNGTTWVYSAPKLPLSASPTSGAVLRSNGTDWKVWGTTIPDTIAQGQMYTTASANTLSPSYTPTLGFATGGTGGINFAGTTSGTVGITVSAAAGTWTLTLPTTAGNSQQLVYSTGATYAYSNATYPGTNSNLTANQLLWSSSTTAVSGLATANNAILVTNGSGVPSVTTNVPSGLTIGTGTTTADDFLFGAMNKSRSGALTTAATTLVNLDTFPAASFRSAQYIVQAVDTVSGAIYFTVVMISMDNSNTVYISEWGTIQSGTAFITLSADYDGTTNVRFRVTPASANSTQMKFYGIVYNL